MLPCRNSETQIFCLDFRWPGILGVRISDPKCFFAIYYYQHFGCPNFGNPNVFSQFSITHILSVQISETQIFSTKISIFCDTLAIIYCQDFGCPNFGNPNVFSQFSITHILGVRISETQISDQIPQSCFVVITIFHIQ